MAIIKNKKLMVIFMSLLILSFSIFSFVLIGINKNKNSSYVSAAGYTITDEAGLTANYTSYSEFYINSLAGLQAFGNSVYSSSSTVAELNQSFEGKTVYLQTDINCGGAALTIGVSKMWGNASASVTATPTFKGTFDGQGHTISNYCLSASSGIGIGGYSISGNAISHSARGLFQEVTGTVQNLRVKSVVSDNGGSGGQNGYSIVYQAALVGLLNGGEVRNCSAEGFSGIGNASGIIAASFSTSWVENCYASGISSTEANTCVGIGPYATKTYTNNSSTQFKDFTVTMMHCVSKGLAVSNLSAQSSYSSITGDNFENLGSNLSNGGGDTGWYCYSEYNDGFPYLRRFITWKSVLFQYSDGTAINTIKIPDSFSSSVADKSKYNPLDFYGHIVRAIISDTSKEFDCWNYSAGSAGYDGIYVAQIKYIEIRLSFVQAENVVAVCGTNTELNMDYGLQKNGTVTITYGTRYRNGGYTSITISFTDVGGTMRSVSYTANSKYYIEKSSIANNGDTSVSLSTDGSISVIAFLKLYDTEFK